MDKKAKLARVLAVSAAVFSAPFLAHGEGSDSSFNVTGFVRLENAISTTGLENTNNQGGNRFQNRTVPRQAYLPPTLAGNTLLQSLVPGLPDTTTWGAVPLPFADNLRRGDRVGSTSSEMNYSTLRTEVELSYKYGPRWDFIARVRALYQPDFAFDQFDWGSLDGDQGGVTGGNKLYHGKPSYYDYRTAAGGRTSQMLEVTGRNYQVYLPAFVVNYNQGDLNIRLGNQQIAWGQALFLRTFDLPNGLDLRRHLILDRALEEFSDKRVPMLSLRIGTQLSDNMLFDSYIGKFQPTVFGNPNTAYNVIPSQFTVHDRYKDKWSQLSGGLRIKADYGTIGWQAAYVRRYNPDGVFSWTKSGVSKQFQGGIGSLGSFVNGLYDAKAPGCTDPTACRQYANSGEALANTPFEASPGGVYSSDEWFYYAADARLQAIEGLNTAIKEFPALQDLFLTTVDNKEQADALLDTVFIAGGGSLRGHIKRDYFVEDVISLGGSYVIESDNELLNQMILNLEALYTPNRHFTAPDLSTDYLKQDEYTVALVVDKWHRLGSAANFPATYLVTEFQTRQRSDLVGRSLDGFDGSMNKSAGGLSGNANYFVFGFTQPLPGKIWEIEFAMLYDLEGGIFVQPGLRWNPGYGVTVDAHYNFVEGGLYGNPNNNLLTAIDSADELSIRLAYQF